jgi:hypothetical protein
MSALRPESGRVPVHQIAGPKAWDKIIRDFLCKVRAHRSLCKEKLTQLCYACLQAGLHETTRAFDLEMIIMNSTFEKEVIPDALTELVHDLSVSFLLTLNPSHCLSIVASRMRKPEILAISKSVKWTMFKMLCIPSLQAP